jgi:hypothetical protein
MTSISKAEQLLEEKVDHNKLRAARKGLETHLEEAKETGIDYRIKGIYENGNGPKLETLGEISDNELELYEEFESFYSE